VPSIFGQLYPSGCYFTNGVVSDCGPASAGSLLSLYGSISWADGLPGTITLTDDCNGGLTPPNNAYSFNSSWSLPPTTGQLCTLTLRATSLQGSMSEASARVMLF